MITYRDCAGKLFITWKSNSFFHYKDYHNPTIKYVEIKTEYFSRIFPVKILFYSYVRLTKNLHVIKQHKLQANFIECQRRKTFKILAKCLAKEDCVAVGLKHGQLKYNSLASDFSCSHYPELFLCDPYLSRYITSVI